MKGHSFRLRLGYALAGIRVALRDEPSFKFQIFAGFGATAMLLVLQPAPIWWALVFVTIAAVLAAELLNTALEGILDLLHPQPHFLIAKAKDCAAAAVLLLSVASLGVGAALIWNFLNSKH